MARGLASSGISDCLEAVEGVLLELESVLEFLDHVGFFLLEALHLPVIWAYVSYIIHSEVLLSALPLVELFLAVLISECLVQVELQALGPSFLQSGDQTTSYSFRRIDSFR